MGIAVYTYVFLCLIWCVVQVAGGWTDQGQDVIDLYGNAKDGQPHTGFKMVSDALDVGAVAINGTAFLIGNDIVYTFLGTEPGPAYALPPSMCGTFSTSGGGLIPGSHSPQNGVTVGPWACFYGGSINASALSPALYCLHTTRMRWARLPCTVPHRSGVVERVGDSIVLVGGGFDPLAQDAAPTNVVDVFYLSV